MDYSLNIVEKEHVIDTIMLMGGSNEVVHLHVDTKIKRPEIMEVYKSDSGNSIDILDVFGKVLASIGIPGKYDRLYTTVSRYGFEIFIVKFNEKVSTVLYQG